MMNNETKHTPGIPDAWLHDGEWALCGALYIYPRDNKFYIGRLSGAREYRDIDGLPFDNIGAAIDHAHWLNDEAIVAVLGRTK